MSDYYTHEELLRVLQCDEDGVVSEYDPEFYLEMEPPKYHVVKFLDKEDGDKYAFVPASWVEVDRPTDNIIVILYPSEDAIATQNRVKNNEQPATDWKQYMCELLHTTNHYGDAKIDTMIKNVEAKEKPAPKNEGVKGEKRKYTRRASNIAPTQPKLPKLNENVHFAQQPKPINETQYGTILNPSPRVIGPMENFFIPIGDFMCQLQVPAQLLELANGLYRNPENACTTPMKDGPNIPFAPKMQTKNEHAGRVAKMNESQMTANENNYDTRCTLRHSRPGPGLVELYANSKVYVDGDQLRRYTNAAGSSRSLIRTLLSLIFTEEALGTCTLTRRKNQLDIAAVNALFNYVANIGRQKTWGDIDDDYFSECVRKKLLEIKRRSGTKSFTQG